MKKTIFLILCILGLLLWAAGFFFGFNYTQKGALMVSIPVAIFVFLLMGGLVFLMKRFSNPKGSDNYKVAKNTERLALIIYTLVSLGTAVYIGHFVSVSLNDKTEIQDKTTKELQELDRIFNIDETFDGSYLAWVANECFNYEKKLEGEGMNPSTIGVNVEQLKEQLVNLSGFSNLQTNVQSFLDECNDAVMNWVWYEVSEKLSLLEANKKKWEEEVEKCALQSEYTKNEPYKCNSKENYTDIASPLLKISGKDFSIPALLLVIVLQIMILLTWLSGRPNTGRDPIRYQNESFARTYGAKRKRGVQNNETVINMDDEE